MLPIECVVRGYLAGSGWKDYQRTGRPRVASFRRGCASRTACPEPIFTPSTKAVEGHDENIDADAAAELVGEERFREVERVSIELYRSAADYAAERGIVIADTKFEFGVDADGELVLADEALTPDSSRFWPADEYRPAARSPRSTSSSCATTARRSAGTRRLPGRSCPRRSSRARAAATSRRSSGSRGSRSTTTSPTRRRSLAMRATVAVRPKPGILDPQGEAVSGSLRHLGFAVSETRVGRLVEIELQAADRETARAEVERMCEQLLANPLIETFEIEIAP